MARVEIGGRRQGLDVWARWIDGRARRPRNSSASPASTRARALTIRTRSRSLVEGFLDPGTANVVLDVPRSPPDPGCNGESVSVAARQLVLRALLELRQSVRTPRQTRTAGDRGPRDGLPIRTRSRPRGRWPDRASSARRRSGRPHRPPDLRRGEVAARATCDDDSRVGTLDGFEDRVGEVHACEE